MNRLCNIIWNLSSTDRSSVISELIENISISSNVRKLLCIALETRELADPTIVLDGIAIPHCRSILVDDFVIVVGRSVKGIPWPDKKVNIFILFLSPVKQGGPSEHTKLLAHIARRLKGGGAEKILTAESPEEIAELLKFKINRIDGNA
ncbi:MAG: PTS sugar transporter subunit IIA [FCB group bacterium]|nr:PTS sugar transporter subunit IIA [FCB group bacterium]